MKNVLSMENMQEEKKTYFGDFLENITKNSKKIAVGTAAGLTLFSGMMAPVDAWFPGHVMRSIPHATLLFENSTIAAARGQINPGTSVMFRTGRVNNRFNIQVIGGTVAQHNGWLGTMHWANARAFNL